MLGGPLQTRGAGQESFLEQSTEIGLGGSGDYTQEPVKGRRLREGRETDIWGWTGVT